MESTEAGGGVMAVAERHTQGIDRVKFTSGVASGKDVSTASGGKPRRRGTTFSLVAAAQGERRQRYV